MHVPGTKMIQLDVLSRRTDLIRDEDKDNENITVLPSDMFIRFANIDLKDFVFRNDHARRCHTRHSKSDKGKTELHL